MSKILAHDSFEYFRADEVAECWNGIIKVPGLYEALWEIVSVQAPIPNIEDSGPFDHVGHENLADHWDKLSEEHQTALNRLAAQRDEELGLL
jgi:hypothetical protein